MRGADHPTLGSILDIEVFFWAACSWTAGGGSVKPPRRNGCHQFVPPHRLGQPKHEPHTAFLPASTDAFAFGDGVAGTDSVIIGMLWAPIFSGLVLNLVSF